MDEKKMEYPDICDLEKEIDRIRKKRKLTYSFLSTLAVFLSAAALAVILGTRVFPIMKITGNSMSPTLNEGDIVLTYEGKIERGDIITFSLGSRNLVKRCIAIGGDTVMMEKDGTVYVNGELIEEPYVNFLTMGDGDIEYPFYVPEDCYFVLGDNRESSIDSRFSEVGTVPYEMAGTKVLFRIWPLLQ